MSFVLRHTVVGLPAVCALLSFVYSVSAANVPGERVDRLVEQVQSHYNRAQTLAVHFVENYSLMGHPRPPEEGTLTLRKQGKMRWEYSRPSGKLFVSDGKVLFLYTAADNRVERVPLKQAEDLRAPMAFLLGRLDLRREFRDFSSRSGTNGTYLIGSAKSDRLPYQDVEMLVHSDGSIGELQVHGRDQSTLAFQFTGEAVNPVLSNALFHFTVPPGAEVVDSIPQQGDGQ